MRTRVLVLWACVLMAQIGFAQANLVKNGDFELGNNGDWVLKPNEKDLATATIATSNGVANSAAAKLGVAQKQLRASFEQTVTLSEDTVDYTFSGVCFYAGAPTNGKTATVQILSEGGEEIKKVEIPTTYVKTGQGGVPADEVEKYTLTFDFNTELKTIVLAFDNQGIDKLIRFDNISIVAKESDPGQETGIYTPDWFEGMQVTTANGAIRITGENLGCVSVYSVTGALVRTVDMSGVNEVLVDDLKKGIYIVGNKKVCL